MRLVEGGIDWLLDILDLQRAGQGVFTGAPAPDAHARSRTFGGQLLAQALAAASLTAPEGFVAQSLHAYFVRPGQAARPTDFEVASMRDGRSSALRKVMAVQRDELVCEVSASFSLALLAPAPASAASAGPAYQVPAPDLGSVEKQYQEARDNFEQDQKLEPLARRLVHYGPLQIMPVAHSTQPPRLSTWIRVNGELMADPNLHACALAYISDLGALHASMLAIGARVGDPQWQVASLDHAVWFHRPFRADGWLLLVFDCTTVAAERGLNHGRVYSQQGELVASITQEALLRRRDPGQA